MKKILANLLCMLVPVKKYRHKIREQLIKPVVIEDKSCKVCDELTNVCNELAQQHQQLRLMCSELKSFSLAQATHAHFAQYRHSFYGKDVYLIGCGPTANLFIPPKKSENTIFIGVNRAFLLPVDLDYLFMQEDLGEMQARANTYRGKDCKKFYARLPDDEYSSPNLRPLSQFNIREAAASTFILSRVKNHRFALDLAAEPMGDFQGTVFSALQFALYTYPKRIFLVGFDGTSGHFYDQNDGNDLSFQNSQWHAAAKFINNHYPNIEVTSINPVSLAGLFADEYTQEPKIPLQKIKFYAFRKNKGATGGPGGVLYLQKTLLGDEYAGLPLEYYFAPDAANDWCDDAAINFVIKNEQLSFGNYYITHDITTAYALSLLCKKYSLVYHQQGARLDELINVAGVNLDEKQTTKIVKMERAAFINAQSVHFPAKGAEDMYFSSPHATTKRHEICIGMPLPNTIDPAFDIEQKEKPSHDELRFICVGTLQHAKGQDQALDFMAIFLDEYKNPISLTFAGDGFLREQLESKATSLMAKYSNFTCKILGRVDHDTIQQLLAESDIYIMLHRVSIFDMATLEAMAMQTTIVLSDVGGNIDFNKDDNIIFVTDDYLAAVDKLLNINIQMLGKKNRVVFEKYFSATAFVTKQHELLDAIMRQRRSDDSDSVRQIRLIEKDHK